MAVVLQNFLHAFYIKCGHCPDTGIKFNIDMDMVTQKFL